MRIGLFTDTYPPNLNGVANSTYILRCQLEKMGNDVFVVAPTSEKGHARWDEEHKVLYLAGMELGFLYGYVATLPVHLHGLEEVRKLKLDVIHAQTEFGVGLFARICAHQLEIPLVSTYHTTYEDYTHYINFIHSDLVDTIAKDAVARLSRLYGDTSMAVIAPSNKTKEMLLRYKIRREINVIPTGLPLDSFSPKLHDPAKTAEIRNAYGIPAQARLVIYVGRIAEEKALDLVIRGFAQAVHQGEDAYLMIVGGGPDEERLAKLIESLHTDGHICMTGPKPAVSVPDFYRAADVFISASLSETQGMTFIEAMASGLPLIARRDEVLDNLIVEGLTGWYFRKEEDLAERIAAFAAMSEEELSAMRTHCLEKVQPYSAEIFGKRVMEVYHHVVTEYNHRLTLDSAKIKGSIVHLELRSERGEEEKVKLTVDDYYNFGLREGGKISRRALARLQDREKSAVAYQKCLNKIAYKDRSCKEMEEYLRRDCECDAETAAELISKLKEKHFLDDERYTENGIERGRAMLMGKDKIFRTLLSKGIPADLIERKMHEKPGDEEENARRYAQKVMRSHAKESVRKLRNVVRMKLIEQGYPAELAAEVAASLDCTQVESKELDNLRKCAEKARKRYEKKYSGTMLRNRIYRYCSIQGYSESDIYTVLDGLEVSDD